MTIHDADLATGDLLALPARTGKSIPALIEFSDGDGSMTILSRYEHGYRSAHHDAAQRHFHTTLWNMHRVVWLNQKGVKVVMTRWSTAEFRFQKVVWVNGKTQPLAPAQPKAHR